MSLNFLAETVAPRQAASRAEDPEVRLPECPHSRCSGPLPCGPCLILGTQLGWLPAILHPSTDRSRPGLTREASTSAPPLAYQCPALGAHVDGACQHPNSLPQPTMQQGRVYTVLEVPGIQASCSGEGMRLGALQETGRQRCAHPVRVPRSPGRRPPNCLSQPTVCQVFSQQTLPLICMTSPTPFTEANTEPQRVETREAASPHTHTHSLRRLRPHFQATTQRARSAGAPGRPRPAAPDPGPRPPGYSPPALTSLGRTSTAAAAHGREDPEELAEARGPVLQGAGRAGPPRVPGSSERGARAGAQGRQRGPRRAVGSISGRGGRGPGAGTQMTVRGAGTAAARGVRRRILARAGLGLGHEPAGRGGALVRRAHAAALTWPPPGGRQRSCSCQEGLQAPARKAR